MSNLLMSTQSQTIMSQTTNTAMEEDTFLAQAKNIPAKTFKLCWDAKKNKEITPLDLNEYPTLSVNPVNPVNPVNKVSEVPFKNINQERTEAMNTLSDKTLMNKFAKTKLCNSMNKGIECPHGSNCTFAHTLEELTIRPCLFGDNCRFVRISRDGYFQNGNIKTCMFKHTGESDDNYFNRVGISKPVPFKPVAQPQPDHRVRKVNLQLTSNIKPNMSPWGKADSIPMMKPRVFAERKVYSTATRPPTPEVYEHETLIRVPKELALQSLELALKSGKTSIKIEIM
jgi:hypothetical protein